MCRREAVKGKTGIAVAAQTFDGGGIGFFIFDAEDRQKLVSLGAALLIENRFELRLDSVILLFGHAAQDIIHFVDDAALALRGGKLGRNGIAHCLIAVCDPKIDLR